MKNPIHLEIQAAAVIFILSLFLTGCDSKEKYVGKYILMKTGNQGVNLELELKADGQGSWTADIDNVTFRWEITGKKILLHTRTGGVIEGEITDNMIHLRLPVTVAGSQSWILQKQDVTRAGEQ